MDSRLIATELEKLQPQPSLKLNDAVIDRAQNAVSEVLKNLAPALMPRVPAILPPRSSEYFAVTRSRKFGMPLSELEESKGGEGAWQGAQAGFAMLGELLREEGNGPYVGGQEVGYADFVVMGLWLFLQVLGRDGDLWARAKGMEGGVFETHYRACEKWAERNDH